MRFEMWKSKAQKGAFLVFTALMIPIIFLCAGFAVDLGNAWAYKSKLQNAADAAVLAGAYQYQADDKNKVDSAELKKNVEDRIDTYMKANNGGIPFSRDKKDDSKNGIFYRFPKEGSTAKGLLLTLHVSEEAPTTFSKMFGFENLHVAVVSTAKITTAVSGGAGPGVFGYALIGARRGTAPENNGQNDLSHNALYFDHPITHITGKVHADGPIWCSDNYKDNDLSKRAFLVDKGNFSTSLSSDYELWSNRTGNGSTYWQHVNTQNGDPYRYSREYSNDDLLPTSDPWFFNPKDGSKNTWWHYQRLGYYEDGSDVVVGSNNSGKTGVQKSDALDVNLTSSNNLTKSIYDYVENYKKEAEKNSLKDERVYVHTDGNYGRAKSTQDTVFRDEVLEYDKKWKPIPYKVVICDGDVTLTDNGLYYGQGENDYMMIISLHGNVNITPKRDRNDKLKALIYAPQGNVWFSNSADAKGSIVAQSIKIHSNFEWDSFHFGESDSPDSQSGSIVLHADDDPNYADASY